MMHVSNSLAASLRALVLQTMNRLVDGTNNNMGSSKVETFNDLVNLVKSTADRKANASDFVFLRRHWKEGMVDPSFRSVNRVLLSDLVALNPTSPNGGHARTRATSMQSVLACLSGLARYLGFIVQKSPLVASFVSDVRRSPRLEGRTPVDYSYKSYPYSSTSVERPAILPVVGASTLVRVPHEGFERGTSQNRKHVGFHSFIQCQRFHLEIAASSFHIGFLGQRIQPTWLRMRQ